MTGANDDPIRMLAYAALEQANLPRPDDVLRVPEGVGNHVYIAGEFVVRIGTGTDGAKFPRALAVMRAVAGRVCVPSILYADTTGRTLPYPVMVVARMPGRALSATWPELAASRRFAVLEAIARELERLHAIPASAAPDAGFCDPWWGDRIAYIERELASHRALDDFPAAWLDNIERYIADHRDALLRSSSGCLLHGDLTWGNVLVESDRLTGIVDFDETRSGPAEEDHWQLLFETGLDNEPWMPVARLRELPGFALDTHYVLPRFRIREIENIFQLLSGTLSWKTADAARQDAIETYRHDFQTTRLERLLEALA